LSGWGWGVEGKKRIKNLLSQGRSKVELSFERMLHLHLMDAVDIAGDDRSQEKLMAQIRSRILFLVIEIHTTRLCEQSRPQTDQRTKKRQRRTYLSLNVRYIIACLESVLASEIFSRDNENKSSESFERFTASS
jgi:hypothetical protein